MTNVRRFRPSSLQACLLLTVLLAFQHSAFGQVSTGSVSGTVTDSSGAVVPGALITLRNEARQTQSTLKTNQEGFYSFDFVPIGSYSVEANQSGFRPQEKTGLPLSAAQSLRVDFKLEIATQGQMVIVTGAAPQL
ncbi:MAG TPA: carboxypeptidase-like regulatory domain-containing protein, partial [Acidobacteriaceae bacterium]|nr:carboxypeptidase-like regulatory domain-containing protein [Acidobacteriaceae bacterium]